MKKNYFLFSLLIFGIFLSSCSKQSANLNAIPEDAILVSSIDFKSLVRKSKLNEVKQMNFYKFLEEEIKNENPLVFEKFEEILKNPLVTGVDFFSNSYVFVSAKNENEAYLGVTLALKNSGKFEDYVQEFFTAVEKTIEIEDINDFKVLKQPKRNLIIGWDDEKILILSAIDQQFSGQEGDRQFKEYYRELITQKSSNSILQNSNFTKFNKNTKDISLWLSMNFVNKISNKKEIQQMSQIISPKMLDESYLATYLDFKNGEIKLSYEADFDDQIFKNIANENIIKDDFNGDVLKYLPKKQFITLSFGVLLEKYYQNIKKLPQLALLGAGFEQEFEQNLGISLQDFLAAFEGDFIFSLTNVDTKSITKKINNEIWIPGYYDEKNNWRPGRYEKRDTVITENQLMPSITFCTTLNDENVFTSAINQIPENLLKSTTDYYEFDLDGIKVFAAMYDNILIITNEMAIINKAKNGGYDTESLAQSDLAEQIVNSCIFAFVNLDFENYPTGLKSEINDNLKKQKAIFQKIISIYDFASFHAEDFKNAEFTITLKSDDENSLYTIINSFDENINDLMQL